jgi:hypothetical protein
MVPRAPERDDMTATGGCRCIRWQPFAARGVRLLGAPRPGASTHVCADAASPQRVAIAPPRDPSEAQSANRGRHLAWRVPGEISAGHSNPSQSRWALASDRHGFRPPPRTPFHATRPRAHAVRRQAGAPAAPRRKSRQGGAVYARTANGGGGVGSKEVGSPVASSASAGAKHAVPGEAGQSVVRRSRPAASTTGQRSPYHPLGHCDCLRGQGTAIRQPHALGAPTPTKS